MADPNVLTPYSNVSEMFQALPSWVPKHEQDRIAAYQVYEDIYWNVPHVFKLTLRGTEDKPIYVPTARTIVETLNRYVGTGFAFRIDPTLGTPAEQLLAAQAITALFRRERMISKYASNKRFGIIKGDWLWHVVADPAKVAGSRISVHAVLPEHYFPVYDVETETRIVKVYIAEPFDDPIAKKSFVRRQTYERQDPTDPTSPIISSLGIYEQDKWYDNPPEDPAKVWLAVEETVAPFALPAEITAIPVYHIKHFDEPGNPFGSSEIRGFERIMAAVNQAVSDEDLALALEGLGVYTTEGGGPVDDEGNETDWIIGPGEVIENAPGFKRVNGIGSVQPYGDHITRMVNFLKDATATSDAAQGKVDATIAESGVSLLMQLGPILAKAGEEDQIIIDVLTQMFFDLKTWFKVYEGINFLACDVLPMFGDKLPKNVKGVIDEVVAMVAAGLMSKATGRKRLAEVGVAFEADEDTLVTGEEAAVAANANAAVDPFAARLNAGAGGAT